MRSRPASFLKDVSLYHDVSAARRLPNGDLLLAGVDFDGVKKNKGDAPLGDPTGRHVLLVEYDPAGREVRRTTYVGDYLRMVRETAAGTYLVGNNTMFRELDRNGNCLREIVVPGFEHAWKALRLPNGDTLMSAGYGTTHQKGSSFMVEVDPTGKIVRKFGAADQVPPKVHPYFYATFQLLLQRGRRGLRELAGPRHDPRRFRRAAPRVRIPRAKIAWQWDNREQVARSSIQAVPWCSDGLDPAVLHDERNGSMQPLKTGG